MCAGAEGLESSERGHAEITAFRPCGREYDHLFDKIKAGLDEAQPGLISESSPFAQRPQRRHHVWPIRNDQKVVGKILPPDGSRLQ